MGLSLVDCLPHILYNYNTHLFSFQPLLQVISLTFSIFCLLLSYFLVKKKQILFSKKPFIRLTENGPKKWKSCLSKNALLMLEVEGEWPYCFELIGSIVQPIGFLTLIHMFGYFKKSNILVILFSPGIQDTNTFVSSYWANVTVTF